MIKSNYRKTLNKDLEDYARKYGYDPGCKVYFKADGHSFENGFRLLFDDASVMDMTNLCLPFGLIELFMDHSTEKSAVDILQTPHQYENYDDDEQLGSDDDLHLGTDVENEDSDYIGSAEEYSDTDSDDTLWSEDDDLQISDEELVKCRKFYKSVKEQMENGTHGEVTRGVSMNTCIDSDESAFNSEELRSTNSSSEDENSKISYVGPPVKKMRKNKLSRVYNPKDVKNGSIKWEVGMAFASIGEFRDVVRLYGIIERRALKFTTNDKLRCKVVCEDKCPFYIWCSKIWGSDKVKEMVEVIGKELEVEVPKIKVLGVRRDALEGVHETLKDMYSRGLDNALKEILPKVEHRLCTRHIYSNFRKRFPSKMLKRQFWNSACATYTSAFERAMKAIKRQNKTSHEHLRKFSPKLWSKSHFSTTSMADNVENNLSKCFNAWIINERYLPLLTMMQEIHHKLMLRIRQKREEILSNDNQVCPRIMKKVNQAVTASRDWRAFWDAIHDSRQQPLDFVSEYYKRDKYIETYKYSLGALRGQDYWKIHSTDEMLPPDIPAKLRGRPKKLRRREGWEGGSRSRSSQPALAQQGSNIQRFNSRRIMHCSICGKTGHRKNKCTQQSAEDEGQGRGQGSGKNREQNGTENRNETGGKNINETAGQTKNEVTTHRSKLTVRRNVQNGDKNQAQGNGETGGKNNRQLGC
ncbi:hypothetical protein AgCh_031170 [Apium graveolens]